MTTTARIATYHRVSTIDQDPAGARAELRAAARMGAMVLEVEETGSGARSDRPGLQRILDGARKGAFDMLLVWKLDRLGRSTLDVLATVKQLTDRGVTVVVSSQGLTCKPGGDAMSNLMLAVLGAVAEFERDIIRDRTRLGMARVKRDGSRSGKAIGRPRKGRAPAGEAVKRLRDAGASWRDIAAELRCTVASARRA